MACVMENIMNAFFNQQVFLWFRKEITKGSTSNSSLLENFKLACCTPLLFSFNILVMSVSAFETVVFLELAGKEITALRPYLKALDAI